MSARDLAEAVEIMDLLPRFFGDGERVKGRFERSPGNRCLVGALDFVSSHHGMNGDGAERYLADETPPRRRTMLAAIVPDSEPARRVCPRDGIGPARLSSQGHLSDFNDGCKDFAELRALILQARASAMHDADAMPVTWRRLDIETEEFVMG